ncbi:MAG: PPC domain-containing protein, partial [Deltaproteobacteria bacterium]|nr:PPC domain-containing protein [Deltaproteobacteria bacterium]
RGRAPEARRVLINGSDNPLVTPVLPMETFCLDVPMPNPGTYTFEVTSQNSGGIFSTGSAMVTVEFDPGAPPILGLVTCSGADPAGCAGATEICENGRDDDCNGLVDDRDPECIECVDDIFEPNDDAAAPRLDPDRYEGLSLCSGNEDYFGVYARAGDTINASLFFSHPSGNIDAELLGLDRSTVVDSSTSTTDDEFVTHTATETGEYMLRVWGPGGAMNGYTLRLDVTSP